MVCTSWHQSSLFDYSYLPVAVFPDQAHGLSMQAQQLKQEQRLLAALLLMSLAY